MGDNNKSNVNKWMNRITKGNKSNEKIVGHCYNYSSIVCLKCNKCWDHYRG